MGAVTRRRGHHASGVQTKHSLSGFDRQPSLMVPIKEKQKTLPSDGSFSFWGYDIWYRADVRDELEMSEV